MNISLQTNRSILGQLNLIVVVAVGMALLVAGTAMMFFDALDARDAMIGDMSILASILGDNSTAALDFSDKTAVDESLGSLKAYPHIIGAAIYNASGTVFSHYRRQNPATVFLPPRPGADGSTLTFEGYGLFRTIKIGDRLLGSIYIFSDLEGIWGRIWRYLKVILLVLPLTTLLVSQIASRVLRLLIEPVLSLAQVAREVSQTKDYSRRATTAVVGATEIDLLTGCFNEMLGQIQHEINDRIVAEEDARKAREIAELNKLSREFLANISHEIRTPMNGIIGMTELILESPLNIEQRGNLEIVHQSARDLLMIINDILDFSRMAAGRLELSPCEFSLQEALRHSVKAMAIRAGQKGVECLIRFGPSVPERLVGDPGRFRQVIINLLGNAVKFTETGEILIEIDIVDEADAEPGQVLLKCTIKDTGIGIAASDQKMIFEPFVQSDGTLMRQFGGTGLGLAISAQIVELMQGKIWVESELGKGSLFGFTARMKRADNGAIVSHGSHIIPELSGRPVAILINHDMTRRILGEQVTRMGLSVATAADVKKAHKAMLNLRMHQQPAPLIILEAGFDPGGDRTWLDTFMDGNRGPGPNFLLLTRAGSKTAPKFTEGKNRLIGPVFPSELRSALLAIIQAEKTEQSGQPEQSDQPEQPESNIPVPEVVSPPPAPSSAIPVGHDSTGHRILVVEDNLVNQTLLRRILERRGFQVTVADGGLRALELLQSQTFHAMLLDVQMPDLDGLQVARRIRELEKQRGGHLPIIAQTAHAMQEDRAQCREIGMDDFISKPYEPEQILRVLAPFLPKSSDGTG